jgi:hypothetical protein
MVSLPQDFHRPQDAEKPSLLIMQHLSKQIKVSFAGLENVPPDSGLQKRDTISTQFVGLVGDQNRLA